MFTPSGKIFNLLTFKQSGSSVEFENSDLLKKILTIVLIATFNKLESRATKPKERIILVFLSLRILLRFIYLYYNCWIPRTY